MTVRNWTSFSLSNAYISEFSVPRLENLIDVNFFTIQIYNQQQTFFTNLTENGMIHLWLENLI